MALDFPNSPSVNQSFNAGGKTWVYNGTKWVLLGVSLNQTVADGSITAAKLAADSVTSAKIAAGAVGTTDLAANAVTQAKLAANVSGITITTTANRDTDISSPFTGQFAFLTDTNTLQRYTGSAWVIAIPTAPAAPTALSGTALSETSVSIAFTPGAENGSAITNYQYALSTNSGSTYDSFTALDPADATSPITISGLTASTTYTIKLRAVNTMGAGTESAGVSVTTLTPLSVDYLVIAGGGGGGGQLGGGGGAGGYRNSHGTTGGGGSAETQLTVLAGTNYDVTVGAGGTGGTGSNFGSNGSNSQLYIITSTGGGGGAYQTQLGRQGGSSGGNSNTFTAGTTPVSPTQGFKGGTGGTQNNASSGGGGAGAQGVDQTVPSGGTAGGAGLASTITGSSVTRGGGGGGANNSGVPGTGNGPAGGVGGGGRGCSYGADDDVAGTVNTGGGGGGGSREVAQGLSGSAGGSGVVILRYSNAYTITIGAGLTGSTGTDGSFKVTTITAGTGNVSWALA